METIKKNINTATKGWETAKSKLSNEYYDINKTIILLKTDDYYLRLFRNDVYRKNNIDYLIINENDYCRNNKNNNTIIKCLKFIRNEN